MKGMKAHIYRTFVLLVGLAVAACSGTSGRPAASFFEQAPQSPNNNAQRVDDVLVDFGKPDMQGRWWIVNDGVMGGISKSELVYSGEGTAIFRGYVSIENNGGFASTRTEPKPLGVSNNHTGFQLRVRGDGKAYQFRVEARTQWGDVTYRYRFVTRAGEWMTIEVPFKQLQPVWRGRILNNAPPASPRAMRQLGFMISDGQEGPFQFEFERITVD